MSPLKALALSLLSLYLFIVLLFWAVWAISLSVGCGPPSQYLPPLPPVDRPVVQPGH